MPPCVVITGASSGIGAACARRFLSEGWDVALLARRQDRLEALAAGHPGALVAAVDLENEASLLRAAAAVAAWRPRLDAVVNCAGDFLLAPIERTTAAQFERIWRLTVAAKFLLVRALLPNLLRDAPAPPRAVIHIASLAAHRDFPGETAYMSAMHAVIGLARAQDAELCGRGIRVSSLSPGLVRTELTERGGFDAAALEAALAPDAIATSVFHLVAATRAGSYIPHLLQLPAAG